MGIVALKLMRPLLIMMMLLPGCGSKQIPGVVSIHPDVTPTHIPGPMPGFGSFQNHSDALLAACPYILSMPNAVTPRPNNPNFKLYWDLSQEYCAWIYHTPDGGYEMSMLATITIQDDPRRRSCYLPPYVRDSRYPDESLGYVFVVHNHPVGQELSRYDIQFIVDQAVIHGLTTKVGDRELPISIVAFFSNSFGGRKIHCDGFYQYIPATGELLKWTVDAHGVWDKEQYGSVTWTGPEKFEIRRKH
jgi:hypothetical protein